MDNKWLTGREAAAYLRVNHRTVLLWAREGKIVERKKNRQLKGA